MTKGRNAASLALSDVVWDKRTLLRSAQKEDYVCPDHRDNGYVQAPIRVALFRWSSASGNLPACNG